jgi:hypothetical protein
MNDMPAADIKYTCSVDIHSNVSDFHMMVNCAILPRITGNLPSTYTDHSQRNIPSDMQLADPNFKQPGRIDLLLGAETFYDIVTCEENQEGSPCTCQHPWIVFGRIPPGSCKNGGRRATNCFVHTEPLDVKLQLFWELEELSNPKLSKEELAYETHFQKYTTRTEDGRFMVRLPVCSSHKQLGDSLKQATQFPEYLQI